MTTTDKTDAFISQCQSLYIFDKNPESLGNQSDDRNLNFKNLEKSLGQRMMKLTVGPHQIT